MNISRACPQGLRPIKFQISISSVVLHTTAKSNFVMCSSKEAQARKVCVNNRFVEVSSEKSNASHRQTDNASHSYIYILSLIL